jgi:hypothetical protein
VAEVSADNSITLPPEMCCGDTPESLITAIYSAIGDTNPKEDKYFWIELFSHVRMMMWMR